MRKSRYSVEDFVLDQEFQKWVLNPDTETKIYWEDYLLKNPSKNHDIVLARKILLNISRKDIQVNESLINDTWSNIEKSLDAINPDELEGKVIPLDPYSSLKKYPVNINSLSKYYAIFRIVAILVVALLLSVSIHYFSKPAVTLKTEIPVEYREHITPPGVKSNLTLVDGSKVVLNSGSSLRYIKNFETNQREVELVGEAYFEVIKDPSRPFIVKTGQVSTQVLGTTFNVKAFKNEMFEVSLLTGLVEVKVNMDIPKSISLVPGEALRYKPETQDIQKGGFDKDKVMAWTQKVIVFENTQMDEIKRVLENWYGVKIHFVNKPSKELEISARFNDQRLKDVLEGLSYSARFDFDIQNDKVFLKFK